MRRVLAICAVLVAAFGLAAEASAAPLRPTLTGTISGSGGWCCGRYATVTGTGTVAGGIGHVSFVANWLSGCDPYSEPRACGTATIIVLTAMNGDTLTLEGGANVQDQGGLVIPWGVLGGTGRFSSTTGSGTVSFNLDYPTSTATLTLTGTLGR